MNLIVPNASYIQTGLRDIITVIEEHYPAECEGELWQLTSEETQHPNVKFMDLFWFFNPTAESVENQIERPLDLVTFGINLNYGNLRINGYEHAREALHNQALFITKDLLSINAAIYPTGLFNIRQLRNGERYRPIEQLFVQYDPQREAWHDELTQSVFQKHNDKIKMTLKRGTENYYYIFEKRQYDLFNYALDFVLSTGLNIVGSKK